MKKIYYSDKARQSAIEEIQAQIGSVMSLKQSEMSYSTALGICKNLIKLADVIYDEVEDKTLIGIYKK